MNTTRIIAKHKTMTRRRNITQQQGRGTKDHNN